MGQAVAKFLLQKFVKVIVPVLLSTFGLFLMFAVIILCIVTAVLTEDKPVPKSKLPPAVEAYRGEMTDVATQFEMTEYVDLLLAIMAQESGGQGLDPMQSSECGYNKIYPKVPNGITNTHYSIECGVQHFRDAKNGATVESANDMVHIKVATQGYNFGLAYVPEAMSKLGYWDQEHVYEFARIRSGNKQRSPDNPLYKTAGMWSYGDQHYPDHVLKYYGNGGDIGDEEFKKLKEEMDKHIGKEYDFGNRGPDKFDCSGFVWYVFNTSGVKNFDYQTAQGLHDMCNEITYESLKPGDLIFFTGTYDTPNPVSHVGVYIGSDQMIDANSKGVGYTDLNANYWRTHLYSYGRFK